MKVRYTLPAAAELDSVLDYVAARSPRAARRVQSRINSALDLIATFPFVGRATRDPGIRRYPVRPYAYLIFYEVTAEEIIIHAVRHGARNPRSMPGSGLT